MTEHPDVRAQIESEYAAQIDDLNEAQDHLNALLREALEPLLKSELFRVRLVEGRVKDFKSLYKKYVEDSKPIPVKEIFSLGGVRDIIGARVVCYNLLDITLIEDALEQRRDFFTFVRGRQGHNKRWLEQPQPSGYRAVHVDLEFQVPKLGKKFQGELQIRTLLQDAWATFVHHDIYKLDGRDINGLEFVTKSLRYLSDSFYAIDQGIEIVRDFFEKHTLAPQFPDSRKDALTHNMYSLISYFDAALIGPNYEKVARTDSYLISAPDVRYHHTIKAHSKKPVRSEILIGGDSEVRAAEDVKLHMIDERGKSRAVKVKLQAVQNNLLRVCAIGTRTDHHYNVECLWRNIFEDDVEYFFAPWPLYYRKAIDYTLHVRSTKPLPVAPRIYEVPDGNFSAGFITTIFNDFISSERLEGRAMSVSETPDGTQYTAHVPSLNRMLFCLIRIKTK